MAGPFQNKVATDLDQRRNLLRPVGVSCGGAQRRTPSVSVLQQNFQRRTENPGPSPFSPSPPASGFLLFDAPGDAPHLRRRRLGEQLVRRRELNPRLISEHDTAREGEREQASEDREEKETRAEGERDQGGERGSQRHKPPSSFIFSSFVDASPASGAQQSAPLTAANSHQFVRSSPAGLGCGRRCGGGVPTVGGSSVTEPGLTGQSPTKVGSHHLSVEVWSCDLRCTVTSLCLVTVSLIFSNNETLQEGNVSQISSVNAEVDSGQTLKASTRGQQPESQKFRANGTKDLQMFVRIIPIKEPKKVTHLNMLLSLA